MAQNPCLSFTVDNANAQQKTAYTETFDVNLQGPCYMEIIPASQSNMASNKDRFAVWNIMWEPM